MQIGKTIKLCREHKGITRSALSSTADISVSYLSLLENNKRDPNISTLNRISTALGIPISVLLFLACDKTEFESISPELAEKFSLLTFKLIEKTSDRASELSA